jgi:hypothetical protein
LARHALEERHQMMSSAELGTSNPDIVLVTIDTTRSDRERFEFAHGVDP